MLSCSGAPVLIKEASRQISLDYDCANGGGVLVRYGQGQKQTLSSQASKANWLMLAPISPPCLTSVQCSVTQTLREQEKDHGQAGQTSRNFLAPRTASSTRKPGL